MLNDTKKLGNPHPYAHYQFFHRNLKHVFADLQLSDKDTLDYITSILTQFARSENLFRIHQFPKFKLESVVEAILQVEAIHHSDESFSENKEIFTRNMLSKKQHENTINHIINEGI